MAYKLTVTAKQAIFLSLREAKDVVFGGAVGGGKSYALLLDYLQEILPSWCKKQNRRPPLSWKGLLLRRTIPQLNELILKSQTLFEPLGATYHQTKREWTFHFVYEFNKNGKKQFLKTNYTLRLDSYDGYGITGGGKKGFENFRGAEFDWIGIDELGDYKEERDITHFFQRLRGLDTEKFAARRFRATCNPGGAGHFWIKERYVDKCYNDVIKLPTESGSFIARAFIPSKLEDNKFLLENNPTYADSITLDVNDKLAYAQRYGDWDIVQGAYFTNWSSAKILTKDLLLNKHFNFKNAGAYNSNWRLFCGVDWGRESPYAFVFVAVNKNRIIILDEDTGEIKYEIPEKSFVVYREFYGLGNGRNKGSQEEPEEVAKKIRDAVNDDELKNVTFLCDPAIDNRDTGGVDNSTMSVFKRLLYTSLVKKANNSRVEGWGVIHRALKQNRFWVFENCINGLRTMPLLQMDERNPADLDSSMEDHWADALRYAMMGTREHIEKEF